MTSHRTPQSGLLYLSGTCSDFLKTLFIKLVYGIVICVLSISKGCSSARVDKNVLLWGMFSPPGTNIHSVFEICEACVPEACVPEACVPEACVPEAWVPEACVSEACVPEACVPLVMGRIYSITCINTV